jgi:hypothetical protein
MKASPAILPLASREALSRGHRCSRATIAKVAKHQEQAAQRQLIEHSPAGAAQRRLRSRQASRAGHGGKLTSQASRPTLRVCDPEMSGGADDARKLQAIAGS